MLMFSVLQVDLLKVTAIPLMKKFGIDGDGLEIKVCQECVSNKILFETNEFGECMS